MSSQAIMFELRANATQFTAEINKANRGIDSLVSAMGSAKAALAGVASLAGAGSLGALVKGAVDAGDSISTLAKQARISTNAVQELQYAAKLSDVEFGAMASSLNILAKNAFAAVTDKGSEAAKAFARLGINAGKFAELTRDQQFEVVAEQIKGLKSDTEQSAAAMAIFGRSGAELLPILLQGAGGIKGLRQEARDLGVVLGEDQVAALAAVDDGMKQLQAQIESLRNVAVAEFAPALGDLTISMRDTLPKAVLEAERAFDNAKGAATEFRDVLAEIAAAVNPFGGHSDRGSLTGWLGDMAGDAWDLSKKWAGMVFQPNIGMFNPDAYKNTAPMLDTGPAPAAPPAPPAPGLSDAQKRVIDPSLRVAVNGLKDQAAATAKLREETRLVTEELTKGRDALRNSILLGDANADTIKRLTADFNEGRISAATFAEGMRKAGEDYSQALGDRARNAIQGALTPQQKLQQEIAKADELLKAHVITWDQYSQIVGKAAMDASDAMKQHQEKMEGIGKAIQGGIDGWAREGADAIVNFASQGKGAFKSLVDSILQDIARIIVQKSIVDPLAGALGNALGSAFGGGGSAGGGGGGGGSPFSEADLLYPNARGGLYKVAGAGGTDSQVVAFRATPGEYVSVTPGGGESMVAQGGGANVTLNINAVDAAGIDTLLVSRRTLLSALVADGVRKSRNSW